MPELCHRCQAELPEPSTRADPALFCPHCSAPQLRLPDYLRAQPATTDTPTPPPPLSRPGSQPAGQSKDHIDWHAALPVAALVALVGAALSVLGLRLAFFDRVSPLWVLASGAIVLGVYLRRRPEARIDARTGWRVGLVTGLLLIGAKGVAVSTTAVVARFVTHSMGPYDRQFAQTSESMIPPAALQDKAFMDQYHRLLASPEVRAGTTLIGAGMQGVFILLFAGLGGLFSGTLETRRRPAGNRR